MTNVADTKRPYTLGLDLGTNSIGWAAVEFDGDQAKSLIDCGVRIFQEAVEAKTRTPKNHARRAARQMRKQLARKRQRRDLLRKILTEAGWLDESFREYAGEAAFNALGDPYQLRRRALDEKLSLAELSRVLIHLNKRRGFQSNRKAQKDEDGVVRKAITELRASMQAISARTLGEYLALQATQRRRYTDRQMYKDEFDAIWDKQRELHSQTLTPEIRAKIHNAIFFQRPLKVQKFLVGKCPFENDRKRAPRALQEAQRMRYLQDVNHLEIKDPKNRSYRKLDESERAKLIVLLEKQKSVSWGAAKKKLGLHENELFNLEEGKKSELIGNRTGVTLRNVLGNAWDVLDESKQRALLTDMLTIDSESGFLTRMESHWRFDKEIAQALLETELEPGYAKLSEKAMRKILPGLMEGLRYDEACAKAEYNHANPQRQGKTYSKLPLPQRMRNPVVSKALHEARKVINAIVREYGLPKTIRIELAREMKLSKKQKELAQKQQKANEKLNKEAAAFLSEKGIKAYAGRDDKIKYRLWKECGHICPYTGIPISQEMLFGSEVDIEHIIPYSRSLDDSYMNKTLCLAKFNRQRKQNRTPLEVFEVNADEYLEVLARIRALPWQKRRRFEQREVKTDEFVERQLNDTRHISVEIKDYVAKLVPQNAIEVSKGAATAELRWQWGLDAVLHPDGVLEKNRADHRHHAIDAIVIALTTRSVFQKISHRFESNFSMNPPWEGFRADIKTRIDTIIVSHAPTRKISGALHEATAYGSGFVWGKDKKGNPIKEQIYVYRRTLNETIGEKQAKVIRDAVVKELVLARLQQCNGDAKKAFGDLEKNPLFHVDGKTPIRSVRVVTRMNPTTVHAMRDREGREYKHAPYGNNHHVEIIEHIETGKRKGIFVTAMEAARRARRSNQSVVQKLPDWFSDEQAYGDEWRFKFALFINDLVVLPNRTVHRLQKLDGSNGVLTFRQASAATQDDDSTRTIMSPNTLTAMPIEVDAIGRLTS
jgi:CRISPR-associated endonuclease Csn1